MHKIWVKNTLLILLSMIFLLISTNYISDPYQHYRKTTIYPPFYGGDQRYLNPGIAKNYSYNSAIIGTSMTEQFYIPNVNKILELEFLKFSLSGATLYEQNYMLKTILEHDKLKRVIWGVDLFSMAGNIESYRNGKENFPFYLYDDNILNDYQYLLNIDTFFEFLKILKKYYIKKERFYYEIDNMFISHNIASKENALNAFYGNKFNQDFKKENYTFEKLKDNFEHNVIPIIQSNKDVEFHIYLPPYSILAWCQISDNNWLDDAYMMKEYMYKRLKTFNNVYFYNFQEEMDFITNLDNYIDTTHYTSSFNDVILKHLKNRDVSAYIVDSKNLMEENIALSKKLYKKEVIK